MKIIREKVMKRRLGTIAALLLCVILTTVNIWADDGKGQDPDYVTDYYMVVQSAEGGINIYAESDPQSEMELQFIFRVKRMAQIIKSGHTHNIME